MKSATRKIIVSSLRITAHDAPWILSIIGWKTVGQDEPHRTLGCGGNNRAFWAAARAVLGFSTKRSFAQFSDRQNAITHDSRSRSWFRNQDLNGKSWSGKR